MVVGAMEGWSADSLTVRRGLGVPKRGGWRAGDSP